MFAFSKLSTIDRGLQLLNGGDAAGAAAYLGKALGQPGAPLEVLLQFPATRLAVYGSLAPGECNQHILAPLPGVWIRGSVHGFMNDAGWGTSLGFRSLVWDAAGGEVTVQVFEAAELPEHWGRLDEFEGAEYRRLLVPVITAAGVVVANLYAANV